MNVTVYTTPTCHYCHQVKQFLSQRGIKFTEHDVSVDRAAAAEMVSKSGQMGVPVITVGNHGNVNPVQKIPIRRILRCLNLKYFEIIINPIRMEITIATKLKLLCKISIGVRTIRSR